MSVELPKMRQLRVYRETDTKIVFYNFDGEFASFQKPISDRWIQHRDNGKLMSLELKLEFSL